MKFGLLPLFLFLCFLPFSHFLDMKIASHFYGVNGFISTQDWNHSLIFMATNYGLLPGKVLAVSAGLIWLLSFYLPSLQIMRKVAFSVALVSFFGICVLINTIVKESWGRPRPRQIVEFGGSERFSAAYSPTWHVPDDNYKSFPSGHVAMGMIFVSLGLAAWKERWYATAFLGLFFGLSFSLLLAYARMAHGAHFFSDVLASLIGMWSFSVLIIALVYPSSKTKQGKVPAKKR